MRIKDYRCVISAYEFTQKEIEIIKLICEEKSAREIGRAVFLAERTVEQYKNNMYKRIGVRGMTGLIAFAFKHGIAQIAPGIPITHQGCTPLHYEAL